MNTATITRSKDYLVIKIPLKDLKAGRRVAISPKDEEAVREGLGAVREGKVSKPLKTRREVISFLRSI